MVSVIIPTYNRAIFLAEAVQSVHNQTYRPIECIVVDDGSTDDTSTVIIELQTLNNVDFKLHYIVQRNAGAQVARNTGTAAATGEYIQYLDSDDLLYPDKLEKQVAYLQKHPDCDGVFGDWDKGTPNLSEHVKAYKADDFISQMLVDRCIHTLSFLFRRSILTGAIEWDPAIRRNQEIDLQVRLFLAGANFNYMSLNTGLWRIHSEERIANTTGLPEVLQFYNKMEQLLIRHHLWTFPLREKIASLYMWLVSENINRPNAELIPVLREAIRLHPDIAFYKNPGLRLLRLLAGTDIAFSVWLNRFRKVNRKNEVHNA